ncbi:MAG: hypothetical protein L0H54_00930 [Alcaligenaceae bacterium]|nr:hypothetical protein [Alcaligenaceae bacterium]
MQKIQSILKQSALITGLGMALLASPPSMAAGESQAQYQADVQRCHKTPGIDQKACLREAGAALEASRRGKLTAPDPNSAKMDRTQRCNALPAEQRDGCITLMTSPDTRVQGSVDSGGVLRETTITIPAGEMN